MARVTIPLAELNDIDLPPMCLITGATEGVAFQEVTLRRPRLLFYLLPLLAMAVNVELVAPTLVLAVILSSVLPVRRVARLPMTARAFERSRVARVIWTTALLVTLPLVALGGLNALAWAVGRNDVQQRGFIVAAILAMGASAVVWFAWVRKGRLVVIALRKTDVVLDLPLDDVATRLQESLFGPPDRLLVPPPASSCAVHPAASAVTLCRRCGGFACTACVRRVRPEALPLCPGCFERRPGA